MISNLQVLRALAALAVVFYHTDFHFFGIHTEFQGVALFFVISGFIMTYISRENADGFLMKRVIRIVPLYWLATFCAALPFMGWLHALHQHQAMPPLPDIGVMIKSLLFVPYLNHDGYMQPLLGVGWTLNLEMFFYLLFAGALAINKRFAPAIAAAVLLAIKAASPLVDSRVLTFYAHPYTTFFILGMACFYIWQAVPVAWLQSRAVLISVASLVAAAFLAANLLRAAAPVMVALPALVIFTALLLHKGGVICRWRPALMLGDASYALYLFHIFLIGFIEREAERWAWLNPKTHLAVSVALMIAASLLAVFIYQKIERPIIKTLRQRFESKRDPAPTQVAKA